MCPVTEARKAAGGWNSWGSSGIVICHLPYDLSYTQTQSIWTQDSVISFSIVVKSTQDTLKIMARAH